MGYTLITMRAATLCALATAAAVPTASLGQEADVANESPGFEDLFADLEGRPAGAESDDNDAESDNNDSEDVELLPTIRLPERSPPEPDFPETRDRRVYLEEIVVTATKREKSLRDIPASISAFSGSQLEDQGNLGLTDYLQKKPGVTLTQLSPGLVRLSVRGISTDASPLSSLPAATGVFIGDTAFSDAYINSVQPDLSAFDLASVELLKGPQGTLFGGTALAGAVRYVLNEPEMDQLQIRGFSQMVSAEEGGSALTSGVALNVPLYEDKLALRLGYVRREYPGVTDIVRRERIEDVDEGSGDQLRGTLMWDPSPELRIKLTHLSQDYATDMAVTTSATRDRRENTRQVLPQPTANDFGFNSLEIGYDFGPVRMISLSSMIDKNMKVYADSTSSVAGELPPGAPTLLGAFSTFLNESEAFAQELRLQSTGSGLEWMVGAYYSQQDVFFDFFIDTILHQRLFGASGLPEDVNQSPLSRRTSLLSATTENRATEQALFFDAGYTFWEDLNVSLGARAYRTEVRGGFFGTGVLATAANGGRDVDYSGNSISEDGINPKLSVTYTFTPEVSTYFLAAKGFRFGGLQSVPSTPTNNVPEAYESDSLWNYEIGLRTTWLDNTLLFDPTIFYIDYRDPQIAQSTQGIPLNFIDNVGRARSTGFEALLRWVTPVSGLSLELQGGVTNSRTTVPFTASDGTVIQPGAKLPGSADSQYSFAIDWLGPQNWFTNVGLHADYTYLGQGFADIQQTIPVNDYATINLGVFLSVPSWALAPKLSLNVSNLSNETAATFGSVGSPLINFGTEFESFVLNPPRMISVRLSLEF